MDKYIGKRIDGRYEIRELIGVGGMANVYKAFDIVDNRLVAVKALRDEYMDNEEFLRRFRNESKAVATLSHPNIVRIYDVSFSQRMNSIVMEYIDGITLKEFIDQQGRLGWKEAVHFTVQVLRGLQHAHDNGIVHRDIKPQNIMLLSDGTIKVTDFGIARFARSNTKTITDRAIGSVHYISPEQAQGGVIDEKTDIYSVGVMMYEMLTGRLPFDADSPVSVALKQIQLEAMPPCKINPDIPEGLEAITMRAMQKDPARRYQSAAEMLRDIDQFKHDPSISFAYRYLSEPPREAGAPAPRQGAQNTHATRVQGGAAPVPPPEENDDEEPPRIPFLSVLTGITFAFVLVSAIFIGMVFYFNNPLATVETIKTPDLIGQKFSTVKYDANLIDNGITIYPEPSFNDKYASDEIFSQDPRPGNEVKIGGTIKVKVSAGQRQMNLMDLSNMESNEAISLLQTKGITSIEETSLYDNTIPEGYIVKTDPEPNALVDASTLVMLYVSMGPENKLITIPDLTGMAVADAKRLLKTVNISISKITPVNNDAEPGIIVRQYPAAGTEVPLGSTAEVEISGGETPGDLVRTRITIQLPPLKSMVMVEAYLGDVLVYEEAVTPGVSTGDTNWTHIYEGSGRKTLSIRLNSQIYQEFTVDFDTGQHRLETDNASSFANGAPEDGASSDGSSSDGASSVGSSSQADTPASSGASGGVGGGDIPPASGSEAPDGNGGD